MDELIKQILNYVKEEINDANLSIKLGNELSDLIRKNSNNLVDKKDYELLQQQLGNFKDYEEISKEANYWKTIKQTLDIETPDNIIEKTKSLSKNEIEKLQKDFEEKQKMITQDYENKINTYKNDLKSLQDNYKREKMLNIAKENNIIDDFQDLTILAFQDKHIIEDDKVYLKENKNIPLNKDGVALTEIEAYKDFILTKENWKKAPPNYSGAGSSNGKTNNDNLPKFWQERFTKIQNKE